MSADLQVVFQDPYSSLNPARTIGQTLAEPLRAHEKPPRAAVAQRVRTMLSRAGRVEELREGALARADIVFRTDVVPWCPEIF